MEAFKQFCSTYPVIQLVEVTVLISCSFPTVLLLFTIQRAPFHANCKILITLWTLAQSILYMSSLKFIYRMLQYEDNYAPKSFLSPPERHDYMRLQLSVATVAGFCELGITLERAASVRNPGVYHNNSPARLVIGVYLLFAILCGAKLGWMMGEGAESSSALIAAGILNCIDLFSFGSNIGVMLYCRRQYARLFAKTSLNARYQVREANDVAHAMISAYISGMCFKILIAALTWLFTFGFEKTGLYFLNESCWIIVRFPAISVSKRLFQLQHLNAGCGAAMFVLKHDRIRIRLAAFLLRRFFKFAKYKQKSPGITSRHIVTWRSILSNAKRTLEVNIGKFTMPDLMPPINSLYAGRSVFITGGTGFVGKVVIEKFLRDVPDIDQIFVLFRPGKNATAAQRWAHFSKALIFNRVRAENPKSLEKVVPVDGDISLDNFGMSEAHLKLVLENTSVVLHCAATVRFNEPLRQAIDLNLKGTDRMIKLCKKMPKLECFLHCSTCYVNADKEGAIEEKLYEPACDPHKLIEASEWMSEEMLEGITSSVTKKYFNTYTFTKHITEELVRRDCSSLPTLIFRPAVCASIWKDGIPGWADAFQGMTANAAGFGTGTIPRKPANPANVLDGVPVDAVSSMMIACAAYRMHLAAKGDRSSLPIFHCSTSDLNPMTVQHYQNLCGTFLTTYPLEKIILSPSVGTRGSPELEDTFHAIKQHFLGPALDVAVGLLGRKPEFAKAFTKARQMFNVSQFSTKSWTFQSRGMLELLNRMQPKDRETFDFDVRKLDWNEFISDVLFGMKHFLSKNDIFSDEKLEAARKNVKVMQALELAASLLFPYLVTVLATGDFKSWKTALPLGLALYYYFHCNQYSQLLLGLLSCLLVVFGAAADDVAVGAAVAADAGDEAAAHPVDLPTAAGPVIDYHWCGRRDGVICGVRASCLRDKNDNEVNVKDDKVTFPEGRSTLVFMAVSDAREWTVENDRTVGLCIWPLLADTWIVKMNGFEPHGPHAIWLQTRKRNHPRAWREGSGETFMEFVLTTGIYDTLASNGFEKFKDLLSRTLHCKGHSKLYAAMPGQTAKPAKSVMCMKDPTSPPGTVRWIYEIKYSNGRDRCQVRENYSQIFFLDFLLATSKAIGDCFLVATWCTETDYQGEQGPEFKREDGSGKCPKNKWLINNEHYYTGLAECKNSLTQTNNASWIVKIGGKDVEMTMAECTEDQKLPMEKIECNLKKGIWTNYANLTMELNRDANVYFETDKVEAKLRMDAKTLRGISYGAIGVVILVLIIFAVKEIAS
ncbi:hypothetical protein PRIPAC_85574, partial [Pristionchus pacificus]|uniref:Fatty acyl-CoA reductase n=1 Tax=Pristionchus pacificus TaxID=54126 RepID=A0A2A6BUM0_PRIPA